jgi:hypothetical protein
VRRGHVGLTIAYAFANSNGHSNGKPIAFSKRNSKLGKVLG